MIVTKKNSFMMRTVAESMRRMFDPTYSFRELLKKDQGFAHTFFEILIAVELLLILQGKRVEPSTSFLCYFKDSLICDEKDPRELFYDFVTLLYFDKRKKLIRAVLEHPKLRYLRADSIIALGIKTIKRENLAKGERQDSDSVKVKGGSKKTVMMAYLRRRKDESGAEWFEEAGSVRAQVFYNAVSDKEEWKQLKERISDYAKRMYRSDRAQRILKILDYHRNTSKKIPQTEMSKDLKISQKSLSHILKAMRHDKDLQHILKSSL